MCRRVNCGQCGRPTFAGCGAHVEQVLGSVAPADRCHCHDEPVKVHARERSDERMATRTRHDP